MYDRIRIQSLGLLSNDQLSISLEDYLSDSKKFQSHHRVAENLLSSIIKFDENLEPITLEDFIIERAKRYRLFEHADYYTIMILDEKIAEEETTVFHLETLEYFVKERKQVPFVFSIVKDSPYEIRRTTYVPLD